MSRKIVTICPSLFHRPQDDVLKLLVLSNQESKALEAGTGQWFGLLLERLLAWLIYYQNISTLISCQLFLTNLTHCFSSKKHRNGARQVCYQQIFIIQIIIPHFLIIQVFHTKSCHPLYFTHGNRSLTWTNTSLTTLNRMASKFRHKHMDETGGGKLCALWWKVITFSPLPSPFLPCDLPPPPPPSPPPTSLSSSASSSSSFPSSFIPPSGARSRSSPIWDKSQTDTRKYREGELLNHACCWHISSSYHSSHISLSDITGVTCLARAAPWPRGGGFRLRLMDSYYLKVNEGSN